MGAKMGTSEQIDGEMGMSSKRNLGQYMTKPKVNIFGLEIFKRWYELVPDGMFMEPFAGGKDIPKLVEEAGCHREWCFYDIDPKSDDVVQRDMILDFPANHGCIAVVSNNPWLSKNSATRRGLSFPETEFDDLYKFSLQVLLDHLDYVACIVPESFITQGLFHDRLMAVVSLTTEMFEDTECPSCLALFVPTHNGTFQMYRMDKFLGTFRELNDAIVHPKHLVDMKFNDPEGGIGVMAIDSNKTNSIRFVPGECIPSTDIKNTSRSITRISISGFSEDELSEIIELCNDILEVERHTTQDVFYTAFKGMREDGKFRRRLDFKNIKRIISIAIQELTNG